MQTVKKVLHNDGGLARRRSGEIKQDSSRLSASFFSHLLPEHIQQLASEVVTVHRSSDNKHPQ